jgi:uncharacterized membrane protein HdeD (DUF308 family)
MLSSTKLIAVIAFGLLIGLPVSIRDTFVRRQIMGPSTSYRNAQPSVADRPDWASDGQCEAMSAALAQNWWLVALRGALAIIFGLIALLLPGVTMLGLVLIFAAYMLVDGVFAITSAVRAIRKKERWGLLAFQGVLSILAGVAAVIWPGITVLAFVILIAAWSLVSGVLMTGAGFQLNVEHGRWWLVLGGLASLCLGIALLIAPLIGAVVLTWWIGAYALVFGALLLALAFKLRARRSEQPTAAAPQRAPT